MALKAIVKNGRIELTVPEDWPEGMEVNIAKAEEEAIDLNKIGLDESEWDDSPEGIAKWLAWMEETDTGEIVEFREPDEMDENFRQYNLDVMRKQIEEYRK